METNFKGRKVLVIDRGDTYSSYDEFFECLGFKNKEHNHGFINGTEAIVFQQAKHPHKNIQLLAIRDSKGNESLIGIDGVKFIDTINTKKQPSYEELLKQRDELLEVVKEIEYQLRKKYHIPNWMYNEANNLITKIEQK